MLYIHLRSLALGNYKPMVSLRLLLIFQDNVISYKDKITSGDFWSGYLNKIIKYNCANFQFNRIILEVS